MIAVLIAVSPFVSRFVVPVSGFSVRPEMAVGLIAGLAVVVDVAFKRRRYKKSQLALLGLLALWLIVGTLASLFFSPVVSASLVIIAWIFLGLCMAAWISLDRRRARQVVRVSIWAAFIASLLAILVWGGTFLGFTSWGVQLDPTYGGYAVYLTSLEANIFAGLITLWSAVAMTRWGATVPAYIRVSVVCLAPVVALAAHTRTALIAWVFSLVIFAFARRARVVRWSIGLLLVGVFFLFASGVSTGGLGLDKFGEIADFGSGTGSYRSLTWEFALQDFLSSGSSLIGLGNNTFGLRHIDPSKPGLTEPWYLGNVFLQVLYDTGILGSVLLVVAALVLVIRTRSFSGFVILATYLILGALTSVLWLAQTWIFVGLALCLLIEDKRSAHVPMESTAVLSRASS
ncbi:O-antigen ligase family protein [Microbacterium sp. che218]|uniref:O-antigen ligase family protein n=1 Tax=Microbacterium sp. che218 TaxID=3140649 RepID=UPI00336C1DAC